MKNTLHGFILALAGAATLLLAGCASEMHSGSASATYKMTTAIAPGVAVPDKVETSIGTLNLNDGYPDDATTQKVYDNLDASRALQAYLLAIPIVNQVGMRTTLREFGPDNQTDVIWENLVDSKTVELTANDNTVYSFSTLIMGRWSSRFLPWSWDSLMIFGITGWRTSASPVRIMAKAASI